MDALSYKTISVNRANADRKWWVVDATGIPLGRLASQVAARLRGKHKVCFTPHDDCGDSVIVINAAQVHLSGSKATNKVYVHHTGYPGGQRHRTAAQMRSRNAARMIEIAVKGMLPKNKLGHQIYANLRVYNGAEHPHAAQNPETFVPQI
jgi:large subunit ribosomal protein L13